MKISKKVLSLLTTLVLLLTVFPVGGLIGHAAEIVDSGECGDNVTWTLDSKGVLTVSGEGNISNSYYASESPFYENKDIMTVIIEDGVTIIGDQAFSGCSSLTSVTIPDSVTRIGNFAFSGCRNLTSVIIGAGVTSIGRLAFPIASESEVGFGSWDGDVFYIQQYLIAAKEEINGDYIIKDGTKCIADRAFYDCTGLTGITIPEGVAYIGASAFEGCELRELTLPGSVKRIGYAAFDLHTFNNRIYYSGTQDDWKNLDIVTVGDQGYDYFSDVLVISTKTQLPLFPRSSSDENILLADINIADLKKAFPETAFISVGQGKSVKVKTDVGETTLALGWIRDAGDEFGLSSRRILITVRGDDINYIDEDTLLQHSGIKIEEDAFYTFDLFTDTYNDSCDGAIVTVTASIYSEDESQTTCYILRTNDGDKFILQDKLNLNEFPELSSGIKITRLGNKYILSNVFRGESNYAVKDVKAGNKYTLGYSTSDFNSYEKVEFTADQEFIQALQSLPTPKENFDDESLSEPTLAFLIDTPVLDSKDGKQNGYILCEAGVFVSGTVCLIGGARADGYEFLKTMYYQSDQALTSFELIRVADNSMKNDLMPFDTFDLVCTSIANDYYDEYTNCTITANGGSVPYFEKTVHGTGIRSFYTMTNNKIQRYICTENSKEIPEYVELYSADADTQFQREFTLSGTKAGIVELTSSSNYSYLVLQHGIIAISDKENTYSYLDDPYIEIKGAIPAENGIFLCANGDTYFLPDSAFEFPQIKDVGSQTTETTIAIETTTESTLETATDPTTEPTTEQMIEPAEDLRSSDPEKAIVNAEKKQVTILPGQAPDDLKNILGGDVTITDKDDNAVESGKKIGTGCIIKTGDGAEYTVIVPGDTDGDGKVGAADARAALRAAAKIEPLSDAYEKAADISGDAKVKATDARTILRVAAKLDGIAKDTLSAVAAA